MSIRIGKFGFVNNFLPYYRLEQNGVRVLEASPRTLTGMFERGDVDFAPVPSFYYIKNKDTLRRYEFCIASKERVLSVVLVSRGAMLDDGCIAVTNQTVTSLNLLTILLRERGLKNRLVFVNERNAGELLKHCTYALVIGDEAIRARMVYREVMDLGKEWRELTGYPMVFGISASRKERNLREVNKLVMESVEWGIKRVDVVAAKAGKKFGIPIEFLHEYFNSLTYRLGAEERKGLALFEEKCHEYRLL